MTEKDAEWLARQCVERSANRGHGTAPLGDPERQQGGDAMSAMPQEPDAFGEQVMSILRRHFPERAVQLAGPMDVVIDGRHLGLDNLYRMVLRDPDNGVEIVECYLEKLIEGDTVSGAPLPFAIAKPRIMPRIQPETIFKHLDREQVAHVPFVNGTVVVFVIDLPQMTVSITSEQMVRWGMQPDDLEAIARENLGRYAPELSIQIIDSKDGGRAAIVSRQDGYDAARLLLTRLYDKLAPELKGDFYVATPARDTFLAMTVNPDEFVDRLQARIDADYQRLPYPITNSLFVAGTAA
jgi:uncharacterized protein YtpQ (UPF0354 family)